MKKNEIAAFLVNARDHGLAVVATTSSGSVYPLDLTSPFSLEGGRFYGRFQRGENWGEGHTSPLVSLAVNVLIED